MATRTRKGDAPIDPTARLSPRVVPGEGHIPNPWMLVGEGPGRDEDREKRPFVGSSGQMFWSGQAQFPGILDAHNLPRCRFYITNVVKQQVRDNETPTEAEIEYFRPQLERELEQVRPEVVVTAGGVAARFFLGPDASMDLVHGLPQWSDRYQLPVVPCLHPAAGLHDTDSMAAVYWDYAQAASFLRGELGLHKTVISDSLVKVVYDLPRQLDSYPYLAADTESLVDGRTWCATVSWDGVHAAFLPADHPTAWDQLRVWMRQPPMTLFMHHALHDIEALRQPPYSLDLASALIWDGVRDDHGRPIPSAKLIDTMVLAFERGKIDPQGLKALAFRRLGVRMRDYEDVVGPTQQAMAAQYLATLLGEAYAGAFPDPEAVASVVDGKVKVSKPWGLTRRLERILNDYDKDPQTNLVKRWLSIDAAVREPAERLCGPLPKADLSHVPRAEAEAYACADAAMTWRLGRWSLDRHRERDLLTVARVDHGAMPFIGAMSRNGMPASRAYFEQLGAEMRTLQAEMTEMLSAVVGYPVNPNSSDQVADLLFNTLGLESVKTTKAGKPSTGKKALQHLRAHPMVEWILQSREFGKIDDAFCENIAARIEQVTEESPIIQELRADGEYTLANELLGQGWGRVYADLMHTRVKTGRLASKAPNLLAIPTRTKLGMRVRAGFIAGPGRRLGSWDMCLAPGTRVLRADLRWVPIETLVEGERLIGIDEHPRRSGRPRQLRTSVVEHTRTHSLAACRLSTSNGCHITASREHPWLVRNRRRNQQGAWHWVQTSDLRVGDELYRFTDPWDDDTTHEGGWIAGLLDGEGSLQRASNLLTFAQNPGAIMDRLRAVLARRGYEFHEPYTRSGAFPGSGSTQHIWMSGLLDIVHLLGTTRPVRLLADLETLWEGKEFRRHRVCKQSPHSDTPVYVTAVTAIGKQPVVAIQTSTRTFIAEGFFTHNSQVEMRVMADRSRDADLIRAYVESRDLHSETAAAVFGVPLAEVSKTQRTVSKCFHPDTEVLTRTGWRRILDLEPGQEIIQAHPSDGPFKSGQGPVRLSWCVPTDVHAETHPSGQLVHLHNVAGMDVRVTPDHRMLGWLASGRWFVCPPAQLDGRARTWANAGLLYDHGRPKYSLPLLRLAVALQADGSIDARGHVYWGFTKARKIARLRQLLTDAGLAYRETVSRERPGRRPITYFKVAASIADHLRAQLDEDKTLPWHWLDLGLEARQAIVEEAAHWDSHRPACNRRYHYSSTIEKNVDVLQALAISVGRKSLKRRVDYQRSPNHAVSFVLSVKDHASTRSGTLQADTSRYTGVVACLSTPTSFVLVRDRGVPVITGQSISFGVIMGITGRGLVDQIRLFGLDPADWPADRCDEYIAQWLDHYKGVRDYQLRCRAEARRYGYIRDLVGREYALPHARCPLSWIREEALRQSHALDVQGSAQGLMKKAQRALMTDLLPACEVMGLDVRPLLFVHDEIILEFPEGAEEIVHAMMVEVMTKTTLLESGVPLETGHGFGQTWADLK